MGLYYTECIILPMFHKIEILRQYIVFSSFEYTLIIQALIFKYQFEVESVWTGANRLPTSIPAKNELTRNVIKPCI